MFQGDVKSDRIHVLFQILPRVHEYEYKPEPGLSKFSMGQKFKAIKAKAANKVCRRFIY